MTKQVKRYSCLMATILSIVLLITTVSAATFADVKTGAWYTEAVSYCTQQGYVSGYSDGTFKPDNTITRAELAVVLASG